MALTNRALVCAYHRVWGLVLLRQHDHVTSAPESPPCGYKMAAWAPPITSAFNAKSFPQALPRRHLCVSHWLKLCYITALAIREAGEGDMLPKMRHISAMIKTVLWLVKEKWGQMMDQSCMFCPTSLTGRGRDHRRAGRQSSSPTPHTYTACLQLSSDHDLMLV